MIRVKKRVLSGHTFMGIFLLTCIWLGFSASSQATTEGLMGYWSFDDVEGSIVPDESGNGLDGILSDQPVPGLKDYPFEETAIVENGHCGKAVFFNGQTSKIIVDNFPGVKGNLTVELWFKMRSIEPSYLFSQGGSIFSPDMILQCIGGELYFSAKVGTESLEIYSASEILINNWYHLAVAIDSKQMKMYLNGNLEDTVAVTKNVSADAGALIFGFGIYPGWWVLDGWMDEVRIYNRALSQEEIQADMDLCHPEDYDATLHSLAGVIRGNFQEGIKVELSGDYTDITYTDKLGGYSFLDLPAGEYTITPQHENCSFIPSTQQVTLDYLNLNQIDFEVSYSGDKSLGIKLWETDPGIFPLSSPTVSEDKVYLGFLDGNLYCFSTENGEKLWEYSVRSPTDEVLLSVTETIVDKNRLYVGCGTWSNGLYNKGKILCLDTGEGVLVWDNPIGHVENWPAIYNNKLYVGSWNLFNGSLGNLYCLNTETGKTVWRYQFDRFIKAGQAIYRGRVYFADIGGNVYCLDAETGEGLWVAAGFGSRNYSSPALSKGRLYIGGDFDRKVHCLDADTGAEVWSYPTGGTVSSSPTVDRNKVYIISFDGYVYCLDADTGEEVWRFQTGGNVWNHSTRWQDLSSPAVVMGKVYVGAWDNRMYCLNAETGEKVWSYDSGGSVGGSAIISQGRVFFGGGIKTFCLKAGSEEVGEWPMFHKNLYRTGCTSVLSGKVVDENGVPLANVTLEVERGGSFFTTSSDDRGYYEFADFSEGTYTMSAIAEGYQKASEQITLNPLIPIDDLDFALQPSICPAILALEGDSNNLNTLRKFRDEVLSKTHIGQEIIRLYYEWSPAIVQSMKEDEKFQEEIKKMIDGILLQINEMNFILLDKTDILLKKYAEIKKMSKQKNLLLTLFMSFIAMVMFVPVLAKAGELKSTTSSGPTRHTLDETYDKPEEVNNKIDLPTGALVEKTGQTTSYETGDDGDLEKGVAWPNPRFTDNGDGTVTDKLTGLIWLKNANCFGKRTWSQALSDCNGLKDLEVGSDCDLSDGSIEGDWRLPNVKELQSLVNYGRYSPPLPSGHPFDNVQFSYYWSSTTIASGVPRAWGVDMYLGIVSVYPKNSNPDVYVWPVRGRQ